MIKKLKIIPFILAVMGLTVVLSACGEEPTDGITDEEIEEVQEKIPESKASQYLSGQTFNKHRGNGADQLVFVDDHTLIVSVEDTLPPTLSSIDDLEDYEGSETIEFEEIELVDSQSGEYLVMYQGDELLKFIINEDDLLEAEDGTTYMAN